MTVELFIEQLRFVDDAVIGIASTTLCVAISLIGLAAVRERRRGRGLLIELVLPTTPAPAGEIVLSYLYELTPTPMRDCLSPRAAPLLLARGSAAGVCLCVSIDQRDLPRAEALLETLWPGISLVRAVPSSSLATASLLWTPSARRSIGVPPVGASAALARMLTRVGRDETIDIVIALGRVRRRRSLFLDLLRPNAPQVHRARTVAEAKDRDEPAAFGCEFAVVASTATHSRATALLHEIEPSIRVASAGVFELGRARRGHTRTETIRAAHPGSVHARDVARIFSVADFAIIASSTPDARRGERLLGLRGHGASELEVRLSLRDSRQHLHLLGATGTGKSTLLLNLAAQDLAAGRAFGVLDPKGDLVRELLTRVPRSRLKDVLYIGPEEGTRVIGVNPLALGPGEDADLVAENVLAIFKRIYEANWGPRTDDLLKSCLLTLLAAPHPTLAQIPALLTNAELRREFTRRIETNFDLAGFWDAYERLSEARRLDITAPLLNKVRDFLLRPRLRRLLCQPRSTVDIGALMNGRGVLLADLSVGRWGESASALAGSFLMLRIWQAAVARAAAAEDDRRDFQLYVDEFQSFLGIGGPFADALAQARALRLSLTLANQHLGQLPREVRDAVAANARSRVVFRCAAQDAAALAAELAPLDAQRLMALAPFEAAVRVATSRGTHTMRTLPPMPAPVGAASADEVRRASAGHFGRPAAETDAEIRASVGRSDNSTDDLFREPKTA